MKLYISVGQAPLAGFMNIDVTKHQINLGNLDNFCDDAECTEIILDGVIQFVPYEKIKDVMLHLLKKLRHGGTFKLTFTDINCIIREYTKGGLNYESLNAMLFGRGACSVMSYTLPVQIARENGYKIRTLDLSLEQVVVIIERE